MKLRVHDGLSRRRIVKGNRIRFQLPVTAHQGEPLALRLRDDRTVERVGMVRWQVRHGRNNSFVLSAKAWPEIR